MTDTMLAVRRQIIAAAIAAGSLKGLIRGPMRQGTVSEHPDSCCEVVRTRLPALGRVDPVEADALALDLDRVAVDDAGAADKILRGKGVGCGENEGHHQK